MPDGTPYEQPDGLGLVGLPFGSVDAGSPRKQKKKAARAAVKDEAPTASASPAGKQRKKA